MRKLIFITLISLFISSCSTTDEVDEIAKKDPSAEDLYKTGKDWLADGRYKKSIKNFEEIERLYPFSKLAGNGQVMVAFGHYKNEEYENSINVIDRFVKLHPAHADISYMYYLKAMNYYDRIADIKRDQAITKKTLSSLKEIRRRFPDSDYARDAKLKEDLVYDHLAGKELEIGRFYLKNRKYIAAINRFQEVVKNFDKTSQIEEALYRLVESYLSLGILDEAQKSAAVLGHNYPKSKWYQYAYALVEEGKNSPVPLNTKSWFQGLLNSDEDPQPLPKDNKADSWFKSLFDFN